MHLNLGKEKKVLSGTIKLKDMQQFMAIIEKSPDTGLYVGHVPGIPGAHSQGATVEELNTNLREVLEMLFEDGAGRSAY